jgi:hypothetical protein
MGWTPHLGALGAAVLTLSAALAAPALAAPSDACALLTPAQVGAVLGAPIQAGAPITPTDHNVCAWHALTGGAYVTVMLQTSAAADRARATYGTMGGRAALSSTPGLGDSAYYLAVGDQLGLTVTKGAYAFKVTVYQPVSVDQKGAAERILATAILSHM